LDKPSTFDIIHRSNSDSSFSSDDVQQDTTNKPKYSDEKLDLFTRGLSFLLIFRKFVQIHEMLFRNSKI